MLAGCIVWMWSSIHQLCNIPSTPRLPGPHHLWEVRLYWGTQVSGTFQHTFVQYISVYHWICLRINHCIPLRILSAVRRSRVSDLWWTFFFFHSTSEIPQYRLPYDVVSFEVDLMKDLGVKVPPQSHDHHMTITWPSHDHHMTITWLSHDYLMIAMGYLLWMNAHLTK